MKAIQLERPEHFRQIDVPEPARPGPGEAVVRVHRVGICGTDFSGYLGKMPFFSYPRIPGHELGVEVVEVGAGVANVKPGDHCSVEPYINCQKCYSCERGHTNCCENHQTLGVHCDGGLRPLFTVPARKLHISRKLTCDQLALVETLAIGCHAVYRSNPQPSETILVIGAGPIGLSVIEFAKLSGARTIVMDVNPQRLAFVREKMGIKETIQASGSPLPLGEGPGEGTDVKTFTDLTEGKLGNVVVDATGSNKSMARSLNFVGFAGRLVYVGITTQEIAFAHPLMHRREMTLLASRNALSADFARIIQLIEDGKIDTRPWISHKAAFDDMIGEFPRWLQPETGVIKAIVDIDG
jgi:2-desacetyl-2-hydroxyethyl bacteriochlorophyllide A dehydrogenase